MTEMGELARLNHSGKVRLLGCELRVVWTRRTGS
jgi:hypothetical protein